MRQRIVHVFIALDQFLWCVGTLGKSYPDITISAAAYLSEKNGRRWAKIVRPAIDFIFSPFEKQHCFNSYVAELKRKQLPEELRGN